MVMLYTVLQFSKKLLVGDQTCHILALHKLFFPYVRASSQVHWQSCGYPKAADSLSYDLVYRHIHISL